MSTRHPDKVTVKIGPADLIVEILGVPHLIIRRSDLSAIEAWQMTVGAIERYYFIEFTTKNGPVTCDYDDRDLWSEILTKLGAAKLFNQMQGEPARQ